MTAGLGAQLRGAHVRPREFGYVVLFFGVLVHLVLGTFYSWGNMTTYVTSYLRGEFPGTRYKTTLWAYLMAPPFQAICMPMGGAWVTKKAGTRAAAAVGAVMSGACMLLLSVAVQHSLAGMIITYGAVWGTATGFAYAAPMVAGISYMPEAKGLISGVVASGYGLGAFVINFVITGYANPHDCKPECPGPDNDYPQFSCPGWIPQDGANASEATDCSDKYFPPDSDVSQSVPGLFRLLALIYTVIACAGCVLIVQQGRPLTPGCQLQPDPRAIGHTEVEADDDPSDTDSETKPVHPGKVNSPEAGKEGGGGARGLAAHKRTLAELPTVEVVREKLAWMLFATFALCGCAGVFVIAQYKTYGQKSSWSTDSTEARINSAMSITNAAGRIVHGTLCDKFGFTRVLAVSTLLSACFHVTLSLTHYSLPLFASWCCMITFFYGGLFAMMPTATAHLYGAASFTGNYGFMMFGFAVGALTIGAVNDALVDAIGFAGMTVVLGCVVFSGFLLSCAVHREVAALHKKLDEPQHAGDAIGA
ncbi:putative MFS-type transporter YhjX [Diplonema papillatum]|nr:putative MFS-type transporter YhjX [Diplonema papillatum]